MFLLLSTVLDYFNRCLGLFRLPEMNNNWLPGFEMDENHPTVIVYLEVFLSRVTVSISKKSPSTAPRRRRHTRGLCDQKLIQAGKVRILGTVDPIRSQKAVQLLIKHPRSVQILIRNGTLPWIPAQPFSISQVQNPLFRPRLGFWEVHFLPPTVVDSSILYGFITWSFFSNFSNN